MTNPKFKVGDLVQHTDFDSIQGIIADVCELTRREDSFELRHPNIIPQYYKIKWFKKESIHKQGNDNNSKFFIEDPKLAYRILNDWVFTELELILVKTSDK